MTCLNGLQQSTNGFGIWEHGDDNGYGTVIVSTSIGVTTGKKATEKKVGGEVVCSVW